MSREPGAVHHHIHPFRLYIWGRDLRSWLVDHIVIEGDVARPEVWDQISNVLGETWPHASGARMSLARLAIDSGDGMTTDAVYGWVRRVGAAQVVTIKGVGFDRSMPVAGRPTSRRPNAAASSGAACGSERWLGESEQGR